jgi:6,7-dimethyl-8-ribityllumazine synthase
MATALKNLSDYNPALIPTASEMRFAIVVAEWNPQITNALCQGAIDTLTKNGAKKSNIHIYPVPGTFELTYGAAAISLNNDADAIICLGCVIQGETRHFDFICGGVTQGITQLNTQGNIPVIFGVLTTDNLQQALDRAGGIHGNKGDEAAITAIKMVAFKRGLK